MLTETSDLILQILEQFLYKNQNVSKSVCYSLTRNKVHEFLFTKCEEIVTKFSYK